MNAAIESANGQTLSIRAKTNLEKAWPPFIDSAAILFTVEILGIPDLYAPVVPRRRGMRQPSRGGVL